MGLLINLDYHWTAVSFLSKKGRQLSRMAQQGFAFNQPVIIDNGSGVIKAGLAGVERPSCEIRSYIGTQKYNRVMMNGWIPDDNLWVGKDLEERRGLCCLDYPIHHGVIENWEGMENIWSYVYSKSGLGLDSKEHPVFLSQCAITPNKQSEKIAEIFFETFNVPALFIAPQCLLSLYASGKGTGLVYDVGDGVTTFFPVCDGFAISPQIKQIDLGGRDITHYLGLLLRKNGYRFNTSNEMDIVRVMKEECCECMTQSTQSVLRNSQVKYTLPDGNEVILGEERYEAMECLFQPSRVGVESRSCNEEAVSVIMNCDMGLRKELFSNILLSGGTTIAKNFAKRALEDMKSLAPTNTKIRLFAPPERSRSAWIGGCIVAGLSPFQNMWITKEDWDLERAICVHRKSLV